MKIRVIITGATGMVGEGVLIQCLNNIHVQEILLINRKPSGIEHRKVKELICPDFNDISNIALQLKDYDACFFCAGVSSIGMKEAEYTKLTYDLTFNFAKQLLRVNSNCTFCYVSGAGTDESVSGRSMWATVKGQLENDLLMLPFKTTYMFRPGYLQPTKGMKNTLKWYKFVDWTYPTLSLFFPSYMGTLRELGNAMISVTLYQPPIRRLDVKNIREQSEFLENQMYNRKLKFKRVD